MNIRINHNTYITADDACFTLHYKSEEFFFKSFDLLVSKLFNITMANSQTESIQELVNEIKEFKTMIYGLYAVSGLYPEIKSKTNKYTGVYYE